MLAGFDGCSMEWISSLASREVSLHYFRVKGSVGIYRRVISDGFYG
jgi:hypothetical protein